MLFTNIAASLLQRAEQDSCSQGQPSLQIRVKAIRSVWIIATNSKLFYIVYSSNFIISFSFFYLFIFVSVFRVKSWALRWISIEMIAALCSEVLFSVSKNMQLQL